MDDYLDQYFSSSSWSDMNVKERSSWVDHSEPDHPDALLSGSLGVYNQDDGFTKNSSPVRMMGSNHAIGCLPAQDISPSLAPSAESGCGVDHGLLPGEGDHGQICSGNSSNEMMMNGNLGFGNMGLKHFHTSAHSSGSLSCSEKDMIPSLPFNGAETSVFRRSLTGLESLSSIPQSSWHPQPYDHGVSSFPSLVGQTRIQRSCLPGENGTLDNEKSINRFVEIDKIFQSETINAKGKQDALYSSFPSEPQITKTMIGLPSLLQGPSPTANNGIGKPRVRARRGQATDPHSIAERLRREKIAERMKNLQELVPNSNKTDKASMLDEIIEYVKFLQLQVKVLSMSRLGAAGAVVPLITDIQAEGSNGLSLSPLAGQGVDFSPSPDQVVFEQEVVKLMESNVKLAMQYLQSKGLCLMPIALAAAISSGKASSSSSSSSGQASEERKKFGYNNSLVNNDSIIVCNSRSSHCSSSSSSNGSLPGVGIHHIPSDGNFMIGKLSGSLMANACNGTFKQEEVNALCSAK
ncbi:hypothetical protein COLO4_21199 [Corchorus olitorius]|uniref:BHLH domain-containing protein n=1 Tax=Corchorus olitorius TaxID=93759 RepID=A0A1R3IUX1_9ROSI|nr:hypothetical protein COLO4_21199 [Corchorus olitorius]